ncbi:MAG: hypothetical protein ABW044_12870 [Cellvibrio sp.]
MNLYLIIAAVLSATAAALHIGCIIFGAAWYRFFGAGEQMAILANQGSLIPTLVTSFIALILFTWSAYALSAAGVIRKLPLIRTALIIITSIYLLRGIAGLFLIKNPGENSPEFWLWSSVICIVYGMFYLVGTKQRWVQLK